ncbi:hypothetical protein DAEQUDRAFT_359932 [Daedalea quercina L-15889]|uniref:Uncharacterized protein n=1 Tax=Daedalea quercina L-15889 TaxID=1314783 RepID=A0A165TST1_9APHY|nr:hypothetical protein DAEQUDRAFT_359932 [Daedalea quercina L-15889]
MTCGREWFQMVDAESPRRWPRVGGHRARTCLRVVAPVSSTSPPDSSGPGTAAAQVGQTNCRAGSCAAPRTLKRGSPHAHAHTDYLFGDFGARFALSLPHSAAGWLAGFSGPLVSTLAGLAVRLAILSVCAVAYRRGPQPAIGASHHVLVLSTAARLGRFWRARCRSGDPAFVYAVSWLVATSISIFALIRANERAGGRDRLIGVEDLVYVRRRCGQGAVFVTVAVPSRIDRRWPKSLWWLSAGAGMWWRTRCCHCGGRTRRGVLYVGRMYDDG